MLTPKPEDSLHKAWLLRLLTELADERGLMNILYFKGGTCAAMLGMLNRFSVDLDFDATIPKKNIPHIRKSLESHFHSLGLEIKDSSKVGIQYFLKYPAPAGKRNTIKIDVLIPPPKNNTYKPAYLAEIDRTLLCQTPETMFANKLVALIDRFEKTGGIAGRDLYDIHAFFLQGFRYRPEIIIERRGADAQTFLKELIAFIEKYVTLTVITQDLNTLLDPKEFQAVRRFLKPETLRFLQEEVQRLETEV